MLQLILASLVAADIADPAEPSSLRQDARAVEVLVNQNYAYLERLPNGRLELTKKLHGEADKVTTRRELVRYTERALALLADHHAITGASLSDSWAVFPSFGDMWVERRGAAYVIEAVREGSPAQLAGVRSGDELLTIDGVPTGRAVQAYWIDLGTKTSAERDGYAARILAAGRRDRLRRLTVGRSLKQRWELTLPNLYSVKRIDRGPLSVSQQGRDLLIKINDSLGEQAVIAAFDRTLARARPGQRIILDLTDTPSGGNTTVARAMLGWFVTKPRFYQVHRLPVEERDTGIPRQWAEQVLPRLGKYHAGPVVVRVGRWTGSMGEGLAIGFNAIGGRVEGTRMAGLLGAIYDHKLPQSGIIMKLPTERLFAVDGTSRESFIPHQVGEKR